MGIGKQRTKKLRSLNLGSTTSGSFCPGDSNSASKVASVSAYGKIPNRFLLVVTTPSTTRARATSSCPLHVTVFSHRSKKNMYSGRTGCVTSNVSRPSDAAATRQNPGAAASIPLLKMASYFGFNSIPKLMRSTPNPWNVTHKL